MIAHIALVRRMPRRIDYLDYSVPESLTIARGDEVLIPFRSTEVRGIVLSLDDTATKSTTRPITSVLKRQAISDDDLDVFEVEAKRLLQSVSTMLHEVFGTKREVIARAIAPQRTSIRRSEVPYIQSAIELVKASSSCFIQATDVVQMTAMAEAIKKALPGEHRVFVPHHHNARWIDGAETRIGSLRLGSLQSVNVVLRSSVPEHASYDRNPRYDARTLLVEKHRHGEGKCIFIDVAPRVTDLAALSDALFVSPELIAETEVIDLEVQKKNGIQSLLSQPLTEAIQSAIDSGRDVLLSYNRKGVSTRLLCKDCGYAPRCKTCGGAPVVYGDEIECHHCRTKAPMLANCPRCGKTHLTERGIGNQKVEKELIKMFPEAIVERIEKGPKLSLRGATGDEATSREIASLRSQRHNKPTIILATHYYTDAIFNPFAPPNFGLVADLMADLGLSDPSYDATEQTMHRLLELRGIAFRAKCPFVAQAWDAEMIRRLVLDPQGFLTEERALREQAQFPPFGTIYRLSTRGDATIAEAKELLSSQLAGLTIREHEERKKPVLEIYVRPGMEGNLASALKMLPDHIIIQTL